MRNIKPDRFRAARELGSRFYCSHIAFSSILAISCLAIGAAGTSNEANGTNRDSLAESREIDRKIQDLEKQSPVAAEMHEIDRELNGLNSEHQTKSATLRARADKLSNSDEWIKFQQARYALERERDTKWDEERRPFIEAAKKIYSSRHEELRSTAVAEVPELRKLGFDVLSFPRLDGSTSTQPLSVILASRAMNLPYEWNYPEPTGSPWSRWRDEQNVLRLPGIGNWDSRRAYEFQIANARVFAKPDVPARDRVAVMINSLLAANSSTHDGIMNLLTRKSDLVLTVRGPSTTEQKEIDEKKVEIELTPVALDALVFIVNEKNPVAGLSLKQVRDVYLLKARQWETFTDKKKFKGEIKPYIREPESGSRELFDALVMKGAPAAAAAKDDVFRRRELYADSMAGPFNALTTEEHGLGYSVWYYEHFMAASAYTRTIAIDGQDPTPQTIASGKYPLTFPIYAASRRSDPPDSPAKRLLAWILSPEGQAVVKESGYVPLGTKQQK